MKSLVDAFSHYAQPMQLKPVTTELNRLLQDVIELHRQNNKINTFELDLDDTLPLVRIDPAGIRQVLNNLVINAADAMADIPSGRLKLRTHQATGSSRRCSRYNPTAGQLRNETHRTAGRNHKHRLIPLKIT